MEIGKLKQIDLDRVLQLNEQEGRGTGPLLVRLGLISERDLAQAYSRIFALPALLDDDLPEVTVDDCPVSIKFMKEHHVVPLVKETDHLVVAMADPEDAYTLQALEMASGVPLSVKIGTISQVERAFDQLYGDGQTRMDDIVEQIEQDDENNGAAASVERLRDLAGEAPIVRLVNLIIHRAIESRASDIHIEPFENRLKVRYRIDGVLQETEAPPVRSTAAVISRIKIMARLNIAERRLPQDGRIQLHYQGKLIDLRVSAVPTLYGESIVLRILDQEQLNLDFGTLGYDALITAKLAKALSMPHGILLVTGPTGSGKTTTLYAALQSLNTPNRKILTVEDPVEYQLEGINQIQVKPQIGLNFADALRSIVRQDPDVIMIGEMRDLETARIAVQSALTGHLVLSTLHTNDAGSSVTRLLDMGVEDYLLTSTLNGILAQRLVRTLCKDCREAYTPLPALVEELQLDDYTAGSDITLFKACGCPLCTDTGYLGRSAITELMILSESIRRLILSHADAGEIQRTAISAGMDTMQVDGHKKALKGITTIEEVSRLIQE